MKLDLSLTPRQELQLRLSPQLIQRVEILQLPTSQLLELVEQECTENDSLVYEPPESERTGTPDGDGAVEREPEEEWAEAAEKAERFQEVLRARARFDGEKDPKLEALANTPAQDGTLSDHLMEQIRFANLDPKVREFAEILVGQLDENGFLPQPLEDIYVPLDDRFTREEAEAALAFLRSLDPPGVAARDMRDCFLSQLDPDHPHYELHRRIVSEHLDDLANNRIPRIARSLGVPVEEVPALVAELRGILKPPPGRLFRREPVVPVRPDIVVEKGEDGDYEVRLAEENYPRLDIDPAYAELYRDPELRGRIRKEIREKVDRARFLIDAIEQRKGTLLRVAREIVDHQREFFENGRLRPLKMRDVADALGLHVSTVSRAIADKWMQTPRGIFPLRKFFTGASTEEGGESRDAVQEMVKEIIDAEDPRNPLSDEDIVAELRKRGVRIARRTVTKYRRLLNIPSSRERRIA